MAEDAERTDNQRQQPVQADPPRNTAEAELNPGAAAAMRRGLDAAAAGDFEAAEAAFVETTTAAPRSARARYNLALARQRLGDSDGAVECYLRAIYLDPSLV